MQKTTCVSYFTLRTPRPRQSPPWAESGEARMRKLNSFAVVAGLILAATGIGVWAASRSAGGGQA